VVALAEQPTLEPHPVGRLERDGMGPGERGGPLLFAAVAGDERDEDREEEQTGAPRRARGGPPSDLAADAASASS